MPKVISIIIASTEEEYERHKPYVARRVAYLERASGVSVQEIKEHTIPCRPGSNKSLILVFPAQAKEILGQEHGQDFKIHVAAHGTIYHVDGVQSGNGAEDMQAFGNNDKPRTVSPEKFFEALQPLLVKPRSLIFHLSCCESTKPVVLQESGKRMPHLQDRLHDAAKLHIENVHVIGYSQSLVAAPSTPGEQVLLFPSGNTFPIEKFLLIRESKSGLTQEKLEILQNYYSDYLNDKVQERNFFINYLSKNFKSYLGEAASLYWQTQIDSQTFLTDFQQAVLGAVEQANQLALQHFPEPQAGRMDCVLACRIRGKLHHLDNFEQTDPTLLNGFKATAKVKLEAFLDDLSQKENNTFLQYVIDTVNSSIADQSSLVGIVLAMKTTLASVLVDDVYAGMAGQPGATIPITIKEGLAVILQDMQANAVMM